MCGEYQMYNLKRLDPRLWLCTHCNYICTVRGGHDDVGHSRTCGSVNQKLLISVVGLVVHYGLDQIADFVP